MHPLAQKVQDYLDTLPQTALELAAIIRSKGIKSYYSYTAENCPVAKLIQQETGVKVAVLPRAGHQHTFGDTVFQGGPTIGIKGDGILPLPKACEDFANNFDMQWREFRTDFVMPDPDTDEEEEEEE